LIPWAITVPFYWLLQSWAGYKGLWQLIHNPFYWEKTDHGLTKFEVGDDVGQSDKVNGRNKASNFTSDQFQ